MVSVDQGIGNLSRAISYHKNRGLLAQREKYDKRQLNWLTLFSILIFESGETKFTLRVRCRVFIGNKRTCTVFVRLYNQDTRPRKQDFLQM